MYFRLILLLYVFNAALAQNLLWPFLILGLLIVSSGYLWVKLSPSANLQNQKSEKSTNPLELKSALVFAVLFSAMGILTNLVNERLGSSGLMGLSFFSGLADVDPYVMSLTQSAGAALALSLAAQAIIIATASNNIMKALYTLIFAHKTIRLKTALALFISGLVSLLALIFI